MDSVLETMLFELEAVGAECVGLDYIRAATDVFAVDLFDQIGTAKVQLIKAGVEVNALGVEHRPHRPVAEKDPVFEQIQKLCLSQ
jgi:hypothetical protein